MPKLDLKRAIQQKAIEAGINLVQKGIWKYALNRPQKGTNNSNPFDGVLKSDLTRDPVVLVSELGTPVFDTLTLEIPEGGSVQTYLYVASVSQSKNIVKTPLAGRNGTIKEYMSDGDYTITLSGTILSGIRDVYPEEQVRQMNEMFKSSVALNCYNNFLQRLGITEVVVNDFSWKEQIGSFSKQDFSVKLISNVSYEEEVINANL